MGLRIYNTQPYPTVFREEDIRQVNVEADYLRVITVDINIQQLRQAKTPTEMHGCFRFNQRLVATFAAVALIETPNAPKKDGGVVSEILATEEVTIYEDSGPLLTTEFLKGERGLRTKYVDKVKDYCERITRYVSQSEGALTALLDGDAPKAALPEGEGEPGAAVAAMQEQRLSNEDETLAVFNQKIEKTIAKIAEIVNQEVAVGASDSDAEGSDQLEPFSETEALALEDASVYAFAFLAGVMGYDAGLDPDDDDDEPESEDEG